MRPLIAVGFAVAALAIQLRVFAAYLPFIAAHPNGTFFGVPLGLSLDAARQARALSPEPIVFLSSGDLVGVDPSPTVFASLTDGLDVTYVDGDHTVLLPSGAATYVVAPGTLDPLDATLRPWQAAGGPFAGGAPRESGPRYAVFRGQSTGAWLPAEWRRVDAPLEDRSRFVGYTAPRQLTPGAPVEVDLAWRIGQPPDSARQESIFAHLVDDGGRAIAGDDAAPLPNTSWRAGDMVISRFSLAVPAALPPGRYWIDFGRYTRPDLRPTRLVDAAGRAGPTSLRAGPVAVPPTSQLQPGLVAAAVDFANQIELDGWDARQQGTTLIIDLQWRALRAPAAEYTVFVHLVGANGQIVAQSDAQPDDGQFPTSDWNTGDRVLDVHPLAIGQVAPGNYHLEVGLYTPADGKRLPTAAGDSYRLETVKLETIRLETIRSGAIRVNASAP